MILNMFFGALSLQMTRRFLEHLKYAHIYRV